jgi:hypothetical protein
MYFIRQQQAIEQEHQQHVLHRPRLLLHGT